MTDQYRTVIRGKIQKQTYSSGQIQHRLSSNECFLMVVFNLDIDDMNRLIEFATATEQVWENISVSYEFNNRCQRHPPSQTASKQRSSHVITTSATVLLSCHRSGASFIRLLRSSIWRSPFAVYLECVRQIQVIRG